MSERISTNVFGYLGIETIQAFYHQTNRMQQYLEQISN